MRSIIYVMTSDPDFAVWDRDMVAAIGVTGADWDEFEPVAVVDDSSGVLIRDETQRHLLHVGRRHTARRRFYLARSQCMASK